MNTPTQAEINLDVLKESKKLEVLLTQSKVGLFGGCLVTTLVVIIFWNRTNHNYLLGWLCFYYAGSYLRYHVGDNDYLRNPQRRTIDKTLVLYTLLTFLCGASWGVMSVYILQGDVLALSLYWRKEWPPAAPRYMPSILLYSYHLHFLPYSPLPLTSSCKKEVLKMFMVS